MDEQIYKRKLKRLEWLTDRADELNTNVFNDEIDIISAEVERYENDKFFNPSPPLSALLEFHIERLDITKSKMAELIGVSKPYIDKILAGYQISAKLKQKLVNIDYHKLKI